MPITDLTAPVVGQGMRYNGELWLPHTLVPADFGAASPREAWRLVGAGGEPAFGTGWGNGDTVNFEPVAFHKDSNGNVVLKGYATRTSGTGTVIFTLPVGYRPTATVWFARVQASGHCYININTDGTVNYTHSTGTAQTPFLDGIFFDPN